MQRLVLLFVLASLLAGCISSVGISPTVPTTPNDFFTGEPTPAMIVLERSQPVAPMAAIAAMSEGSSDDTENPLVANIHVQRFTATGMVDFQRFYTADVPRNAPVVELPVELPAEQRYQVTATIYDPNATSAEGHYVLAEAGAQKNLAVMANHSNRIPVPVGALNYDVISPPVLYSGGNLRQIDIAIPKEYNLTDITRFYGLNPWGKNSTKAFWEANGGHAGTGVPNTGWLNSGNAPFVDAPTTLYYQFRACMPMQTQQGTKHVCAYIPDIESGEPLFEITILPEPND